jgi:hypothetical protein
MPMTAKDRSQLAIGFGLMAPYAFAAYLFGNRDPFFVGVAIWATLICCPVSVVLTLASLRGKVSPWQLLMTVTSR